MHPYQHFGTELPVLYGAFVEVTERGPFVHGRKIDLSYAATAEIGLLGADADRVEVY